MNNVQKLGNSLAVRIPMALANEVGIEAGTAVEITTQNGSIVVRPRKRPKYRLRDLLKGSRPSHFHREIDLGPDVGRETLAHR